MSMYTVQIISNLRIFNSSLPLSRDHRFHSLFIDKHKSSEAEIAYQCPPVPPLLLLWYKFLSTESLYTIATATQPSRIILRSPLHLKSSATHSRVMAATTTDGSSDDLHTRTQQSPLASKRAQQSNTPTEANRKGRFGGFFTLGYKEGFSQWVRYSTFSEPWLAVLNGSIVGKCTSGSGGTYCLVICILPAEAPNAYANRLGAAFRQRLYYVSV